MSTPPHEVRLDVFEHTTQEVGVFDLLISTRDISSSRAEVCVGHLGRPNSSATLKAGDCIQFAKADTEVFEIRLWSLWSDTYAMWGKLWPRDRATLLIRPIPIGPFVGTQPIPPFDPLVSTPESNTPLDNADLRRVHRAVEELRGAVRKLGVLPDSLSIVDDHLDRMEGAATKLGRRDWVTLVLGTLTNIVIVGTLGPDPARSLFALAARLLNWCFSASPSLP